MSEEYVKISRETYDELIRTRQEFDDYQINISESLDKKLEEAEALGFEYFYKLKLDNRIYSRVNAEIRVYTRDESLLQLNKDLEKYKLLLDTRENKLAKIPSWIRRLFKAD